jgi:hypothetical protein
MRGAVGVPVDEFPDDPLPLLLEDELEPLDEVEPLFTGAMVLGVFHTGCAPDLAIPF